MDNSIEFVSLSEIKKEQLIDLMNNPLVNKYLPLLNQGFTMKECCDFLARKKRLWEEHGYGPYAVLIKGEFAGWGGLQPENEEVHIALVLHPNFWGWGFEIFLAIKKHAFDQMCLESITTLLPPTRHNSKAIMRLGFVEDGQISINNESFVKFRLTNPMSP